MPNRTIYVPNAADWERWQESAWKARLSVSEYIRRAVEAYAGKAVAESPKSVVLTSFTDEDAGNAAAVRGGLVDRTNPDWKLPRGPFSKEQQTRKKRSA